MPILLSKRYAFVGEGQHTVLCRDCSTRSNGIMIPFDERNDHDIWHEFKDHVDKGAALLDEKVPDWRTRVNAQSLDLSVGSECVIGQVYFLEYVLPENSSWHHAGAFFFGCDQLGIRPDQASYYGFDMSPGRDLSAEYQYDLLIQHWRWQVSA